jgi:matrix metalloproteinase-14 (membrane-inserted)
MPKQLSWLVMMLVAGSILPSRLGAYTANGVTWGQVPVPYYINTTNQDLPGADVELAMQAGANVWANQSGATVGFTYAGTSTQTTTGFDQMNLVVFRNASSGSAIATTYWWSNGTNIIDADIVFWDAAFLFFSGSTGCAGGFYIEDIAAHEFGHAIGLGHSTVTGATMYPSVSTCNQGNRTLDGDDIAGARSLYPLLAAPSSVQNVRVIKTP